MKEPQNLISILHRDYILVLDAAVYEQILASKPHIAIRYIMNNIKPPYLKERMKTFIVWRKDEEYEKRFQIGHAGAFSSSRKATELKRYPVSDRNQNEIFG